MDGEPEVVDSIAELITNYNELNPAAVEELYEEPSPLEFMRFVARNTPFVVRGAAADWKATRKWNVGFIKDSLRGETVNVAVTPQGNADSPTRHTDGTLVFAKPWEEQQPIDEFLDYVIAQERAAPAGEVRYAQTQNDNLRHEYATLFKDVQRDVPFARIALGAVSGPDAINLWIGNSRSVTALHRDNYENLYVQVAGRKRFVLLPPHCQPCVNEQLLPPADYVRSSSSSSSSTTQTTTADRYPSLLGLALVKPEEAEATVPFPTWDPDLPDQNSTAYSGLAEPLRVTLEPGDMLYLPCMWYHKVSQSCSAEGICVAVNYWYDMDFRGPLYPLSTFVRSVNNQQTM